MKLEKGLSDKENGDSMSTSSRSGVGRISQNQRADILIEALPYIKKFRGKRVVIKLGGAVLDDPVLEKNMIEDIVLLHFVGILPIVVHGGGKQISRMMKKLGKESSFLDGRRITDAETMHIAQMVLAGHVSKSIASSISALGSDAVGISGHDGRLLEAVKLPEDLGLGQVGKISRINISYLERLYSQNIIPVISPIGIAATGEVLNINADEVATEIACALCVERLIFISDVPGVMQADGNLISRIEIGEMEALKMSEKISGGMLVKLAAAKKAIMDGVRGVQIISGVKPHSLLTELFTNEGVGTKII